jgi:AraC-like DNA-binding protein
VNGYRVNEAKRLMSENPNMKIVDVATQAGFSSRTVFSSIFTKETGVSPSEWSKQQAGNVDDTDKSSIPSDKL